MSYKADKKTLKFFENMGKWQAHSSKKKQSKEKEKAKEEKEKGIRDEGICKEENHRQ